MGTASRSVEIGDRARRSLCGHRRRQWPSRPAVPPPQGGKGPFPDGNWIARLNLLAVLDVIWELNVLIGAGKGCGIERVRFGSAPCFTRSFYEVPV